MADKKKYKPSEAVKKRITDWEGAAMYKPMADTGRVNYSFDEVNNAFLGVLPYQLQSWLSQDALDALYSYAYNVGPGNFKKRVVPHLLDLQRTYNANKDIRPIMSTIANSMYGTRDKELRGLHNRRVFEKEMFRQSIDNMVLMNNNRVNWNTDPSSIQGYIDHKQWVDNSFKNWDNSMKTLENQIENPNQQKYITYLPTEVQQLTSPVTTLQTTPTEDKTKDVLGQATSKLADYFNDIDNRIDAYDEFLKSQPEVVFKSNTPPLITPNWDYSLS